jgi:hypothetical protein
LVDGDKGTVDPRVGGVMAVKLKVVCDGPIGNTGYLNAVSCRERHMKELTGCEQSIMDNAWHAPSGMLIRTRRSP